jgi:tripartite-type tricarboxylate transporter receptor subunit TctC
MSTHRAALALACALAASGAQAQAEPSTRYPAKFLRLIIPWPAGGGADIIGRTVALKLGEALGVQVIADNRAGATGIIGTEAGAKAQPDGYTLVQGNSAILAINPGVHAKLPYDPVASFAPISLVNHAALLIVVHPSLPVRDVRELIALAKKRPGQLNYASSGTGGSGHLGAEMFKQAAGVDIVHVPYKGGAPAAIDVMAGQASLMFADRLSAVPHVKAGKLKALAVTSSKRAAGLPDVPTIEEAGGPALEAAAWTGILAPAGTPEAIVERLNRELVRIVATQDFRERMTASGGEAVSTSPSQFGAFIRSEQARWSKAARDAGVRAE